MAKTGLRVPRTQNFIFIASETETCKKLVGQITKKNVMTEKFSDQCKDPTQSLTIELPCKMLERIERYAEENKTDIAGVLIEALDNFLRRSWHGDQ
jgi:hypothetical protein